MKRVLHALSVVGAIGSGIAVLLCLFPSLGGVPGTHIDFGAVATTGLVTAVFAVVAVRLNRKPPEEPSAEPPVIVEPPPLSEPVEENDPVIEAAERSLRRRRLLLVVTPVLLVGGCVGYVFFDSAVAMRETSQFNVCNRNRRDLDNAIVEFTMEKKRPPQSLKELVDAKLGGKPPPCPIDGVYSLVKGKDAPLISNCSVHGSADNPTPQKHPFM